MRCFGLRFLEGFMRIRMAGATDIGRKRKANQDSIFYDESQGLGVVADGIGLNESKKPRYGQSSFI